MSKPIKVKKYSRLIVLVIIVVSGLLIYRYYPVSVPGYVAKYRQLLANEVAIIDKKFGIANKTMFEQCFSQKTGKTSTTLFCEIRFNILINKTDQLTDYIDTPLRIDQSNMTCEKNKSKEPTVYSLTIQCYEDVDKPYFPLVSL
jgi:hypothetical protein